MPARLIDSLATTGALADLFSDDSILSAMLEFEVALTRAEADLGIVPRSAAKAIEAVAKETAIDASAISKETLRAGNPVIPFVKILTDHVRSVDSAAAGFVHWGATSQDVSDTALVLLLKRAQSPIADDISRLENILARMSEQHKDTVMLGRTLMQAAPPVTFGLKAAGWLASVHRSRRRLDAAFSEALILQLGGASGTLASLGEHGVAVTCALAEELGIACPEAPWHTHRDRLANLACCCGVLTGTLGKMARDITLLAQSEIEEVAEPGGEGRGGSSTMPHKRNPVGSVETLAAANRVAGLVAPFLSATVQENERATGGWQSEWPIMASLVQSTGLAAACMAEVAEGLTVDPRRMRSNIEHTNGAIFAERAMMLLGATLGRDTAHKVLEKATRNGIPQGRHLAEVLAEMPEVTSRIEESVLRDLEVPQKYLGSAEAFRTRLLSSADPEKLPHNKEQ
jgi:3-carboxy-cis,cis-muconate cycloisomerase